MTLPVAALDRATRRRVRSTHDPKKTPFLRKKEDMRRVYLALPPATDWREPYRVMFAVGAFAGLRPSEIFALDWERDIDLGAHRIHVPWQAKEGKLELLKDEESRVVPIIDTLLPILRDWKMVTGGTGLCFPPDRRGGRPGRPPRFRRLHTLNEQVTRALEKVGLSTDLTWYHCTRHSFASHWVMDGRPIEKLKEILGHSSIQVTERYAHLRPDMFNQADYEAVSVDLSESKVLAFPTRKSQTESPIGHLAVKGSGKTQ